MKNQAVLLVFAALFSASIAATVPWGFNCTAVVSNDSWQCGSDFAIPDLASQLGLVLPNNTAIEDYGVKICIQERLSLAHPNRWSADSCTWYKEVAPTQVAPVSVPVEAPKAEAPKAEPVAAPVEAPNAAPVAAPVEPPKAEPVAAPVAAPVEPPKAEPVAAPKPAFVFSAVNADGFLASGRYVIGVAFVKPPTGNFSHSLPFQLTGSVCDGKFGDFACATTPVQGTFNGNVSFNLAPGASDSFTAQINNVLYGSITITTSPVVGLHLRRDAYPFTTEKQFSYNDANSKDGKLVINNPAPGDYLIAALLDGNATSTDFSFEASAKVCNASANVAGPDCTTSVVELAAATGQLFDGNASTAMVYYKLKVDLLNKTRLSFSVASKTSAPTPRVYVRWGNLPDENTYDYVGCSTEYCAVNQVDLEILSGSAGDWYIGVAAAPNTSEPYAFGIWHGSVCPNNCGGDHGTCNTSGKEMGTCTCTAGFTAIDCSESAKPGLSPEMIVLIVMGALVVLSAVIGFIAWAYMRKKRGYDEIN